MKNFLDTIHFSKDGMEFVADEFYKEIKKSMKILIVGSSGYLGGRIYEYFKTNTIYTNLIKKKNYKVDIVIIVAGPNSRNVNYKKKKIQLKE